MTLTIGLLIPLLGTMLGAAFVGVVFAGAESGTMNISLISMICHSCSPSESECETFNLF